MRWNADPSDSKFIFCQRRNSFKAFANNKQPPKAAGASPSMSLWRNSLEHEYEDLKVSTPDSFSGLVFFFFYCHVRFFHLIRIFVIFREAFSLRATKPDIKVLLITVSSNWQLPPIQLLSELYDHNCHTAPPRLCPHPRKSPSRLRVSNILVLLYFYPQLPFV